MLEFYEPNLDCSSSELCNVLGIIVCLKESVDGGILQEVVEKLRSRFPYFYVKVTSREGDLIAVPNSMPMTVRSTWNPINLNSKESNYHLAAWKYENQRLAFEINHSLTDGEGVLPYIRSAIYLYLSKVTGKAFSPEGFKLPGEEITESETGNPFRNMDFDSVKAPFYKRKPIPDFFRLVRNSEENKRVFYLKLPEAQVMQYCRDQDASPNVLISVLLAKAARRFDPDSKKTITVSVTINHKAMLGTPFNYRKFVGEGTIDFPKSMDMSDIVKSCTIARGQLILQAQPENSLWDIKQCILGAPAPSLDTPMASICVSYPKIKNLGDMNSYIEGLYVVTTLKKMTDILCEITCVNNSFFLAFMQPFSSFEYYRCFLKELELAGIDFQEIDNEPLRMSNLNYCE